MLEAKKTLSFEAFASLPEYQEVNERFVDLIPIADNQLIVEIGSGRGNLTEFLFKKAPQAEIICIDIARTLLIAGKNKLGQNKIHFIQGRAEDLPNFLNVKADGVIIGNAIHNFANKPQLIEAVYNILKPGGFFAFNSAFAKEGMPRSERPFYTHWMRHTRTNLEVWAKVDPEILIKGEKPEARRQLSLNEYCKLLEEVGFKIIIDENHRVVPVILGLNAFQAISADPDFISGVLQDLNVKKEEYLRSGSQILKTAAALAFAQLGQNSSVRVWIQLIAQKF